MDANLRHFPADTDPPVPTSTFRRSAWRSFQRTLDPLGAPRTLPSTPGADPSDEPLSASRAA